jgi:hypothetical protein
LKPALTDLNVATQLNLMVVMAACNGAALATAISLTDRAPFWGFIGPTKPLSSAALLSAYGAFYRELLSTKSPSKAVVALEAHSDHDAFWRATAQGVFETVWKGYLKEYCAPDRLKERILHMRSRFHEHTGILAEPELLEQMLRQSEPQSFARFLSTYFMHDLYPLHIQRFDIPYIGLASSHVA